MAVANILRSCMLTRPSCTQGFCPSCPGALQYACSYISNFPSFVTSNKSTVAAVTRKRVLLVSSFCTNVDATSSVTSPSSTAPTLATPVTGTKEGTLSSSINPVASNDQIKDAANMLDIRVGCILKAWKHEEAESLYVEEVDVGEPEPRIICSGLVNYIPLDQLQISFWKLGLESCHHLRYDYVLSRAKK